MVDLNTWRAVIGVFYGKVQVRTKCKQNRSGDFVKVSWETDTNTHISSIDVVVGFVLIFMLYGVTVSFIQNVIESVSFNSTMYYSNGQKGTGIECVDEGLCVNTSMCPLDMHVQMLLSAFCAMRVVFSLRRLLLSGDIETNPGPNTEEKTQTKGEVEKNTYTLIEQDKLVDAMMQAMQNQLREQTTVLRSDMSEIKQDLSQVKQQCEEINKRCDRLETEQKHLTDTMKDITYDIHDLFAVSDERKEEMQQCYETIDSMRQELDKLKADTEKLESFSRRDNLRFYGIPQQGPSESFDTCARAVVDVLNSIDGQKQWTDNDIGRAHRTGYRRDDQPRPMIVKFNRWKDKMCVIGDREVREKLQQKGVRVANDLTNQQMKIKTRAREEGKRAFFRRGQLVIGPRLPDPRTYAEVVEGGRENDKTNTYTVTPSTHQFQSGDSGEGGILSVSANQQASRPVNTLRGDGSEGGGFTPSSAPPPPVRATPDRQRSGNGGKNGGCRAARDRGGGQRIGSAASSGDSPRVSTDRRHGNDERTARGGVVSNRQSGMRAYLSNQSNTSQCGERGTGGTRTLRSNSVKSK